MASNYSPPALKDPLFFYEIFSEPTNHKSLLTSACVIVILCSRKEAPSRKTKTTRGTMIIRAKHKNYETDLESGCWAVQLIRLPTLPLGEKLRRITSRAVEQYLEQMRESLTIQTMNRLKQRNLLTWQNYLTWSSNPKGPKANKRDDHVRSTHLD